MAITGRFLADFSDFMTAVQKADVALKGMETGAGDVTKMLNKMTDSFSGRKIVQEATLMAQAFELLASQGIALTNKELQKMGATAEEAIAKLKAGGEAIPAGIQKIADAAKAARTAMAALDDQAQAVQKHFAAFSGDQIIAEAHAVAKAVEQIGGASKLTAAEQEKVNRTVTEAIGKYAALGQTAPKALQSLAAATKAVAGPMSSLQDQLKGIQQHVSAFSGDKIIQEASQIASAVREIGGASKLTEKEMASVNATVTEAIDKYKALGQAAPQAMTDLAKATSTAAAPTSLLGKTMGDMGTQLKATALGFISAQAIIGGVSAAFNALTNFVLGSVEAFAAAETASKKVEAALLAQGDAVPGLADQYVELASAFEETTGFADDLLQEMQALLIEVGDVGPAQMEAALKAATDLSVGLGKDLKDTTLAVAKAFEGNTTALKKMVPSMDEAAVKAGDMAAAFAAVEERVGGQAAARMETYAGKVLDLANAWDNLQESVGKLIVSSPVITALLRELNDAVKEGELAADNSANAWSNFLDKIPGAEMLRDNVRLLEAWAVGANIAAESAKKAAREVKFWADAQKEFDAALAAPPAKSRAQQEAENNAAFAASIKKVTDATDELSAAQKRLIAAAPKNWGPEKIAKELKVSQDAVEAYTVSLKAGTKATDDLTRAQERNAAEGIAHTAKQIAEEYAALAKVFQDYEQNVTKASRTTTAKVEDMGTAYKNFGKDVAEIIRVLGIIKAPSIELPHIPFIDVEERILKPLDRIKANTAAADAKAKEFTKSLTGMAQALANLGKVSGGFGKVAQDMATLVNAIATGRTAADSMKQGLADLGEKGKTGDALLAIGTSALTMASAFLQATETGTAMQKTLKGAALGASIGKQWGWIGAAIGAAAGALAGFIRSLNASRNAVKDFAKSMGGFDELRAQLRILGDEGERLWKKLTQGSNTPAQAQATAKEITKALETVPKALNDMVRAAVTGGAALDAAMVPYIKDLIEAGQLTEANTNLLLGLPAAGVPAFAAVEAAAEALGLPIDAIGQSIQQMKFSDAADKIAAHLAVLRDAGADMDAVLDGAKGKIQELVSEAQRTGKSLPEAMKPFLQQMVDSGKLTDLFGDKLGDLEDLHFTKPLEKSVEDLVDALMLLVKTIQDDVGGALDDLGKKVVRPKIAPEYLPPQGAPSGAAAPPPPPTTPEPAAPPPALAEGEAKIREAPIEPPPATLTVIMEIDGRTAAASVVPYMPGEAKRFVAT